MRIGDRLALITLIVILVLAGYCGWRIWRTMEDAGYQSCIASVMSDLQLAIEADRIKPKDYKDRLPKDGSWKFLTAAEVDEVLKQVQGTDCSKHDDITVDPWGRKVNVAARILEGRSKVVLWSSGPDGRLGTDDDLVDLGNYEIPHN